MIKFPKDTSQGVDLLKLPSSHLFIILFFFITGCAGQRYKPSDHYDGSIFFNPPPFKEHKLSDFFKWIAERKNRNWPDWVEIETSDEVDLHNNGSFNYTFINHSTVLIQVDGFNIITDPIYSERASPVQFAGPKRVHAPGIPFSKLPKIDYIIVSHNHYDHMDKKTLTELIQRDQPVILSGLGNKDILESWGAKNVHELDWKESVQFSKLQFTFVRAQHFSARGIFDRDKSLWGGFMIKTSHGFIYFAGDTGYGDFIKTELSQYQPLALSFIPIGAYEPQWFMAPVHTNPQEALLIHQELNSKYSVGIHFGTFPLADDDYDAPAKSIKELINKKDLNSFVVPKVGETIHLFKNQN